MGNDKNANGLAELEKRLWAAADQLWANSPLRPSEYSTPVLGLIFLRFADNAFTKAEAELKGKATGRRAIGRTDYQARGVVYLPDEARFSRLLQLPESADIGKHLNDAMKAIMEDLRRTRDLLLPKLISGALDVAKLAIEPVERDTGIACQPGANHSHSH